MSRRECLVILVVILGIAAVAVPNLLSARYRGAQKRTMGDIRTVGTSIESWSSDHHGYPIVASVDELARLVEPTYVKVLPRVDGWGRTLEVACDGTNYVISSRGGDGLWAAASLPRLPNGGFAGSPSTWEIVRDWLR